MRELKDKKIILGITGSIAAYKVFELIKLLKNSEAKVFPILTQAATKFITPLTVEVIAQTKVYIDIFEEPLLHTKLTKEAHLFLVAPATANLINKYATGIADDLLTTSLLTFRGPVIIAPAMNSRMYESQQVQKNIQYLKSIGIKFIEPEVGALACGEEGVGRLAKVERIFEAVVSEFTEKDLKNEHIVVTAGPTREYIDSIRFITNKSSGKMGYALAKIAKRRGAKVILVSGPSSIEHPAVDSFIEVETTSQMLDAVMGNIDEATVLIMAAAPLDFKPREKFEKKIDKSSINSIPIKLNPDILKEVSKLKKRPFTVGFAAEDGLNIERAKRKLNEKKLDMIVLNDIATGFNSDTNEGVIIFKRNDKYFEEKIPLVSKEEFSSLILTKVLELKVGF
ncbi:MAG: bifunctional phosphopantothenoylcysteine decarboxylase/phosphopantothenate--cysteine ligase CoaBC [Thermodesulfovibrio sp.]|nr:bifunctional phosphopantothenoylcysteine decarboxylase/phosphopantothenate--cysteine ligase CoaBC [Thermodesulfovibrio sp.]